MTEISTKPAAVAAINDLPSTGVMSTNPALTVAGVMSVVTIIVGFLVAGGYYQPSPEIREWADQYGLTATTLVVSACLYIQGWVIRNHVVSPATARIALGQLLPH